MGLSDNVQNMKFMRREGEPVGDSGKKSGSKTHVLDTSEWSASARPKVMKVLKARRRKVRSVGYAAIAGVQAAVGGAGPKAGASGASGAADGTGRRVLGESSKKEAKSKASSKPEQDSEAPQEEPATQRTKSLKALWKANMK